MENSNGICVYCNKIIPGNALFCSNPECNCMQILVPTAIGKQREANVRSFNELIDVATQNGYQGMEAYNKARKAGMNPVVVAVICLLAGVVLTQWNQISNRVTETTAWKLAQSQNTSSASDGDGHSIEIYEAGSSADDSAGESADSYITIYDEDSSADSSQLSTTDGYIIADSNSRYLDESDIQGLSSSDIQLIINEIYARHGRAFKSEELQAYFSAKSWYTCVEGKTDEQIYSEFNEYEKANVEFLNKHR
ncbi:MAG: YARHG domain-containing protein [Lachnospiraceae bacterium]|nr:YARHG domain-containing protein [Lachnospiraceae bacterium]